VAKSGNRRKHPRFKLLQEIYAGWRSGGETVVARVNTIALGGLYLNTSKPLAKGSKIDLVVSLPTSELYTRATVRDSRPGMGMGLEFIHLHPAAQAKLRQFLSHEVNNSHAPSVPAISDSQPVAVEAHQPVDQVSFERELKRFIEVADKGTYYQLLSVGPEFTTNQVKKSYYALARKFHPDHHMDKSELTEPLQDLMTVVTEAYNTLTDEQKRSDYDRELAVSGVFIPQSGATESEDSVDEFLERANACLAAKNVPGSIVWLRKCVERAPDEAQYHVMLARSFATVARDRREAIAHFQQAIRLDPGNAAVYFEFGRLYEEMQLRWHARPLYARALEIDPKYSEAQYRLERIDSSRRKKKWRSFLFRMFGG
jgi:curved DNA-binding protein CbpA